MARKVNNSLVSDYIEQLKYHKACEKLDESFEDAFSYTVTGKGQSRLMSTKLLERLNEEVRRREKVIRIISLPIV